MSHDWGDFIAISSLDPTRHILDGRLSGDRDVGRSQHAKTPLPPISLHGWVQIKSNSDDIEAVSNFCLLRMRVLTHLIVLR